MVKLAQESFEEPRIHINTLKLHAEVSFLIKIMANILQCYKP